RSSGVHGVVQDTPGLLIDRTAQRTVPGRGGLSPAPGPGVHSSRIGEKERRLRMNTNAPRKLQEVAYEREAQAYLRSLPLEHFMEATAQAKQRKITLASLTLLEARRRDVKVFNELLVQYPRRGQRKLGQVVPDNMLVRTELPIQANSSYNV